ncbi:putative gp61 [Burkholderia pseudomallei MSHR5613]|nr:putative gp61 [Burkholderia pseudomallei MSHR4378]KGS41381.1 putative gp61 [Burkholderia pseudomallei MSHR5613]
MDAGLWIWDGAARLMLDGTTRCGRIVGMQRIQEGMDGSAAADLSRGEPFWAFMPDWLFRHISMNAPVPNVEINAGGVRWWFSRDGNSSNRTPVPGWLVYGVF